MRKGYCAIGSNGKALLFAGAEPLTIAEDYRNPGPVALTLGLDHEITPDFGAGADFHHVNSTNLRGHKDFNLPSPMLRAEDPTVIPDIDRRARPIASLGSGTVRESSVQSLYGDCTVSAKYRPDNVFQWEPFHTWPETLSDDDNERSAS